MQKKLFRIISGLLLLACLLPLGACGGNLESTENTETAENVEGPAFVKNGALVYAKIIRSDSASSDLTEAATALYNQIRHITGLDPEYESDLLTYDSADNDAFEILIGATNRPESSEKLKELTYKDWYIGLSGNKLLIIGGSDDATIDALDSFSSHLADAFEGRNAGEDVTLDYIYSSITYEAEYTGRDIKIAGTQMSQFTVVYNSGDTEGSKTVKDYIVSAFADACGASLAVARSNSSVTEHEIVLGTVSERPESEAFSSGWAGTIPYSINCREGKLYVSGRSSWGLTYAGMRLMELVNNGTNLNEGFSETGDAAGQYLFGLTEGADIRIMSNNVWKCDNNQTAWAAMGEDCSAKTRSIGFAAIYAAFKPDIINFQEMSEVMLLLVKKKLNESGNKYMMLTASATEQDDTPILYNSETLTMIDNGHHIYTYGNNSKTKGYHWALFEHIATGTQFIDLTTHLWWKSESAEAGSDASRARQAAEIVTLSEKLIEKYNVPMIMMGDLNTTTLSAAYKTLQNGGFEDCHDLAEVKDDTRGHHQCSSTGYSTELYAGNYTNTAIDHALIKNKETWKMLCFRQPTTDFFWKLTDHVPMYVDISFD